MTEPTDVFDAISARLMALGAPVVALIPKADELHCKAEFAAFVEAWSETVRAWDAYLTADAERVAALAPRIDVPNAGPVRPIH